MAHTAVWANLCCRTSFFICLRRESQTATSKRNYELKSVFKLAAALIVASVLAACSTAQTALPGGTDRGAALLPMHPAGYHEPMSAAHGAIVAQYLQQGNRHADSFVQTNCQDWYQETTPGVQDPTHDQYLGTTCDTLWVPDQSIQSPNQYAPLGPGGVGGLSGCTLRNTGSCVADESSCNGGRALNSSANGQDGHQNMIATEYEDFMNVNGVVQPMGWEYVTYGQQEYFQFAFSISITAGGTINVVSLGGGASTTEGVIVPYSGSAYNSFMGYLNMLHIAKNLLPFPYNALAPTTSATRIKCATVNSGKPA